MSTHPFTKRINMNQLRFDLCGSKHTIPKDFSTYIKGMQLYEGFDLIGGKYEHYTKPIFRANVVVVPHKPHPKGYHAASHRIFIVCSCGREIPAGRVTQHTHKDEL